MNLTSTSNPTLNFGDYKDTKMVGKGGFSVVFSGTHLDTNFSVAIKSISKENLLDKTFFMNFKREIRIIKSIDHPFIVHFYRIMEDDKYIYIVMENCPNGTLLQHMNKKGRLSEAEAQLIFSQLLSALRYLHIERQIVHRDIKMENVLLTSQGTIRLIDFGLSGELFIRDESESSSFSSNNTNEERPAIRRKRSNSVLLQTQCGSFPYAAPEIFRKKHYNATVDMWSAGVILYVMVTGHLPFSNKNSNRLIQMIMHEDPVYPSYLSSELVDLLSNLLNKDRRSRFTVQQASEHPWITRSLNSFFATEYFISQKQFRIFPQTAQDIDREVLGRIVQLDIPIDGFDSEIIDLVSKFNDSSIRYFNITTSGNVNAQLSSSTGLIGFNENKMQAENEHDRFGPNTVIKLNPNIRESQALQYYRMMKNEKISELLASQIKSTNNPQLSSFSSDKLPSLKTGSSSPLKNPNGVTILTDLDTQNSGAPSAPISPIQTPNMRTSVMRRPVGQLELILLRKKQSSATTRSSMPIAWNNNKQ